MSRGMNWAKSTSQDHRRRFAASQRPFSDFPLPQEVRPPRKKFIAGPNPLSATVRMNSKKSSKPVTLPSFNLPPMPTEFDDD